MKDRTFVGFGFGAIQGGLFLYEAHRSGNFDRLVVAEVLDDVVAAVRAANGCYGLNIATPSGIERVQVEGVEIYNPRDAADCEQLVAAMAEAGEAATALPSVRFYGSGEAGSVTRILADAIARKQQNAALPPLMFYTAENNNHAAEILEAQVTPCLTAGGGRPAVQFLNTVIGKMSGVVTDAAQIGEQDLLPVTPDAGRAFLVEAFNRILISRVEPSMGPRGITAFEEKADLLPFEEAKLFGHNATHALIGYLGAARGLEWVADAGAVPEIAAVARSAFIEESGEALCRKQAGVDPLFTPEGYRAYADDLLVRMVNPHLRDTVERVTRDPRRKLGWNDRLVGTMRVVVSQGLTPAGYARGAAAAVRMLQQEDGRPADALLREIWAEADAPADEQAAVLALLQ